MSLCMCLLKLHNQPTETIKDLKLGFGAAHNISTTLNTAEAKLPHTYRIMATTNLDEVQWRAPEWIQMNGLRTDNVLEYFAQSPFYDRSSNNQVLKMQSQFNVGLQGRQDLYKELQNMKGIEFVVALERAPTLWVIRKQNRLGPHDVRQIATYFVVNENIFMAPSIFDVINSRLLSITHSLTKSLEIASSLPSFSPSQGYAYKSDSTASSSSGATQLQQGSSPRSDRTPARTPAPVNMDTPQTPSNTNTLPSFNMSIADEKAMERALASALAPTTNFLPEQ